MGTADDRAVGAADMVVVIQVQELEPAGTGAIGPALPERVAGAALGGVERIPIVAVRRQAVERSDRIAHLVDHGILLTGGYLGGTEEIRRRSVELDDLIRVMTAVESHVPELALAQVAGIPERKLDTLVVHLADIDEGGACRARSGRKSGRKQQVVRLPVVHVDAEIPLALEQREIQPNVHRLVLFPLQVRIAQCGLPVARQNRGAVSTDIVERLSRCAAKLVFGATRRDVLVSGDAPSEA